MASTKEELEREREKERERLRAYYTKRLHDLESDYAILVDQEAVVVQMIVNCNEIIDLFDCLKTNKNYIDDLVAYPEIDELVSLANWDDLEAQYNSIKADSQASIDKYKTICSQIDAAKTWVAKEIAIAKCYI